jgi:hypothetical protein
MVAKMSHYFRKFVITIWKSKQKVSNLLLVLAPLKHCSAAQLEAAEFSTGTSKFESDRHG